MVRGNAAGWRCGKAAQRCALLALLSLGGCGESEPARASRPAASAALVAFDSEQAQTVPPAQFIELYDTGAALTGARYSYKGLCGGYHYICKETLLPRGGETFPAVLVEGVYRCHRSKLPAGFPDHPQPLPQLQVLPDELQRRVDAAQQPELQPDERRCRTNLPDEAPPDFRDPQLENWGAAAAGDISPEEIDRRIEEIRKEKAKDEDAARDTLP